MSANPQHFRFASPLGSAVANALLFNVSWLAIVLPQSSLWAPFVVMLHLAVHFRFFAYGLAEARLILMVTLLGVVLDQLLFLAGVFTRSGAPSLPPLWLSCLWPVLATTLMHSFRALQARPLAAAILGAAGGALTYMAGTQMTVIDFASPLWGPVTLGLLWALLFPALLVGANLAGSGRRRHAAA